MIQVKQTISRICILIASSFLALAILWVFIGTNQAGASQTNVRPNISSSATIYSTDVLSDINTLYMPLIFQDYTPPFWTFLGPENVNVATFEVDPISSDTIYAGTYDEGLWRTQDGGQSWEILNNGIPTTYSVRYITTAPTVPTIIYVSVDDFNRVYRSLDGGKSWEPLTPPTSYRIYSLEVNPVTPTIIYAGAGVIDAFGGGYVMRSLDGGNSWEQILPENTLANKIVVDLQNPQIVYVASSSEGVLKSLDSGNSWQNMNNGLPNNPSVTKLTINSDDSSSFMYLSGTGGLYNSIDGGENWINISQSLPQSYYSDFAFNVNTGNLFIATRTSTQPNPNCEGDIYRSSNNGLSWQHITDNPNNFCAEKIIFAGNDFQRSIFMLIGDYSGAQIWQLSPINP